MDLPEWGKELLIIMFTSSLPMGFPVWLSPAHSDSRVAFAVKLAWSALALAEAHAEALGTCTWHLLRHMLKCTCTLTAKFGKDRSVNSRAHAEQTYGQKTQIVVWYMYILYFVFVFGQVLPKGMSELTWNTHTSNYYLAWPNHIHSKQTQKGKQPF